MEFRNLKRVAKTFNPDIQVPPAPSPVPSNPNAMSLPEFGGWAGGIGADFLRGLFSDPSGKKYKEMDFQKASKAAQAKRKAEEERVFQAGFSKAQKDAKRQQDFASLLGRVFPERTPAPVPSPSVSPSIVPSMVPSPTIMPSPVPNVAGVQDSKTFQDISQKAKATPTPSPSAFSGRTDKFKSAYKDPKTHGFVDVIVKAAQAEGVPPDLMLDIAAQESMLGLIDRTQGYHPTQRSASGLYQFVAPTWASYAQKYADDLGIDVPKQFSQASPWSDQWKSALYSDEGLQWVDDYRMNPEINAALAAKIIRDGGLGNWDASKNVWGQGYKQEEIAPFYSR